MSKVITDTEAVGILQGIVENGDMEAETYRCFLKDVGQLIADYCGGEVSFVDESMDPDKPGYLIGFHHNDSVPEDGGVFKDLDTDVSIEEWQEDA